MNVPEAVAIRPTCDHLALHARRRPRAAALLLEGSPVDFATLHRDLGAATRAIAALGLPPGSTVAVGLEAFYPQLLATLALEQLGLVTAGFRLDEGAALTALLARADLTLVRDPDFAAPARALHVLPPDWLATTSGDGPAWHRPALPGNAPMLVLRSSGTTGQPKMIEITRAMLHERVARRIGAFGIGRATRYLATMHLGVQISLLGVLATLRVGGLVISETGMPILPAIRRRQPTVMYLLPYQLSELVETAAAAPALPDATRAALKLVVGGGKLSPTVRLAALEHLCREVMATYGSNETGNISALDPDGVARVVAGTELQVVDQDGKLVPPGAAGEVRVRGPTVARRYLDDEAATAKVFRDGWCYLGDQALHLAPGRMRLLGRHDDVLNIGGVKRSAEDVEATILERARGAGLALSDVAVLMGGTETGHPLLIVCAAVLPDTDQMRLATGLQKIVPGHFVLRIVSKVPRTAGGKVQRNELRRAVSTKASDAVPSKAMA